MARLRPHRSRDALNPVWNLYRSYQPTEALAQSGLDGAQGRLHDLELQRHVRHLAGEASLPNVFWWLLVGFHDATGSTGPSGDGHHQEGLTPPGRTRRR